MPRGNPLTEEQQEDCIQWCYESLSDGCLRTERHAQWAKRFNLHWRTCDEFCNEARKRFVKELGEQRTTHRSSSLAVYTSIIQRTNSYMVKIKAQERIDKLMGLEDSQPLRVEGAGGEIKLVIRQGLENGREDTNSTEEAVENREDDSISADGARARKIEWKRERHIRDNGS